MLFTPLLVLLASRPSVVYLSCRIKLGGGPAGLFWFIIVITWICIILNENPSGTFLL